MSLLGSIMDPIGSITGGLGGMFGGLRSLGKGGILNGLGGGGQQQGNQTITNVNQPPAYALPYLTDIASKAQGNYNNGGPQYYGGNTVAPFSGYQTQAQDLQAQRALSGSPLDRTASDQLTQTMNGGFFGLNPANASLQSTANGDYLHGSHYLNQQMQASQNQIRKGIDSQFATSGRYGSGLAQTALGQAFSDSNNNLLGQNYMQERNNQLNAAGQLGANWNNERQNQLAAVPMASNLANQDYTNLAALSQVGGQQQQQSQAKIDAQKAKWDYNQNLPQMNLSNYLGNITGAAGNYGTQIQTNPIYKNQTAGMLGGALSGAATGSMFGPWGAAIGGGLGLLAGRQ